MKVRRLALIFVALVILIICSAAFVIAEDIARDNPIIHKIFNIKEVPVEKIITKVETVYVEKEVIKEVHWYQFYATGYSPDDPKQGTNRIMASEKEVLEGAVAADPKVLPLGTKIEIRGLLNNKDGIYIVEDIGGKIKGLDIDIFRENKFEALQINQMVWIRIIEEEEK